jgi:hypothetical protein
MVDTDTDTIERTVALSRDSDVLVVGLVAGVTLLVDTVGRWLLTAVLGAGVGPLALLVVLATVIVGSRARWGLAVGLLGSGLLIGDWTGGVISAFAAFAAAILCTRLQVRPRGDSAVNWLARYATVAVSTALTLVAVTAWLSDLFGVTAFSIVVAQSLGGNVVLVLLGAPVAWLAADIGLTNGWRTDREGVSVRGLVLLLVVLSVWVGGGALGSFMYQAANTVPATVFGRRLGSVAERVVVLGGPQGRYAVTALSLVVVAAVVAVIAVFGDE